MEIVRQLDEDLWREFVENHPHSQIFHTPEMFEVFSRARGYKPTLWAVIDNNGRPLVLLLPVHITVKSGLLHQFTTRAVAYGSVLYVSETRDQEALAMLLDTYKRKAKQTSIFTELRNLTDLSDVQYILQKYNFVYEEHLNFLINLQRPVEEIWCNVHSNVRTNVRKARRMGVVVEEITSLDKVPVA